MSPYHLNEENLHLIIFLFVFIGVLKQYEKAQAAKTRLVSKFLKVAKRYNSYSNVGMIEQPQSLLEEIPTYTPSSIADSARNVLDCIEMSNRAKEELEITKKEVLSNIKFFRDQIRKAQHNINMVCTENQNSFLYCHMTRLEAHKNHLSSIAQKMGLL